MKQDRLIHVNEVIEKRAKKGMCFNRESWESTGLLIGIRLYVIQRRKGKKIANELRRNLFNRHALRGKSPSTSGRPLRFPVIPSLSFPPPPPISFSFPRFAVKVIHVIALFCIEATMTSPFYREYRKVRVDPRKCRAGNTARWRRYP